jgi:hypothetical protein
MSELSPELAEKLTAVSDEYMAARLQSAVHKLGMDTVLNGIHEVELAHEVMADADDETWGAYTDMHLMGMDEEHELSDSEKLDEAYADFEKKVSRKLGRIGVYWLNYVEPNALAITDEKDTSSRLAGDGELTSLTLVRGDGDRLVALKRISNFPNGSRSEEPDTYDTLALEETLDKLQEVVTELSPNRKES